MNKEFIENLEILKIDLLDEELSKKYFTLKNLIENSFVLKVLRKKIDLVKKCKMNKVQNCIYNRLIKRYNSHSLVKEFNNVCDDVKNLLIEIKMEIEN